VQVVLEKTDKPKAASYSLAKRLLTQGVDLPTSVKIGKSAEPMFQAILAAGLAIDEKGMGVLRVST